MPFLHDVLVSPQAHSHKANQPWSETMSQNKSFLLLFCFLGYFVTVTKASTQEFGTRESGVIAVIT
jgi:hypothetical protein